MTGRHGLAAVLMWLLTACGGGGGGTGGGDAAPLQLATPGQAVVKVRSQGTAWAALAETSRSPEIPTRPDRRLLLSPPDGGSGGADFVPPAGWSLLDFALHPSGQLSLLLGSDRELRLLRVSAAGQVLREQDFLDPLAASDPFVGNPRDARDPQSLLPHITRDAARLAPLGEDVALAFRSGRHAVVLHRLGYAAGTGFTGQWRRIVEPGVYIGARFMTSGSFDPFKSLDHQWRVVLDADPQGRIALAVSLDFTDGAEGHTQYFGETLDPQLFNGVLLSQFSATGQRVGTAAIDTQYRGELHALRWVGGQVAVAGRVRSAGTADGWDAFLALVPAGATTLAAYRVLDFDAGDVILDIAQRADGGLLVVGSTGYTQNPSGASVSEGARPLLAQLAADGQLQQRLTPTAGLRHNQLRALALRGNGAWLLGGMENGPGTHSADADPALLKADGYLREQRL
jgi:hypothetical protein